MSNIYDFAPLWGEWNITQLLGKGSFGSVYKAEKFEYGNTYTCAIKHIQIPFENFDESTIYSEGLATDEESLSQYYDSLLQKLLLEINTCYQLKGHTNIVSYEDHSVVKRQDQKGYDIFIRMEYLTSLSDYMRTTPFDEKEIVKLGIDVCNGLMVMDKRNMIHRDIKPANILVNQDGTYKIGDFSEAKMITQAMGNMSIRGTYGFMAPEIIKGEPANKTVDIYALGLVLYRLLNFNKPPFTGDASVKLTSELAEESNAKRFRGEAMPSPAQCTTPMLQQAILKACAYYPAHRFQSAKEFCDELQKILKYLENPCDNMANINHLDTGTVLVNVANVQTNNAWNYPPNTEGWSIGMSNTNSSNTIPYSQSVNNQYSTHSNNNQIVVPKKKNTLPYILLVILCIIIAGIVGILMVSRNNSKDSTEIHADNTGDESTEINQAENKETTTEATTEEHIMSSYIGSSYTTTKEQLDKLGMKVSATYEANNDIPEGQIISQNISDGQVIVTGTEINFVVSSGPIPCPYEYEQKVTVTAAAGSSNATLTLYEWQKGDWVSLYTCSAKVGRNGIGANYGEGNGITPAGTFKLGVVLSNTNIPGNMLCQLVSSSTCVVDDVNSPLYNIICDVSQVPYGTSYDPIGKNIVGPNLNAAIFIEHNGNGYTSDNVVPGRCSVITVCGCEYAPIATAGCVDITAAELNVLLGLLNKDKNPYIEIYSY